jgi:hypothetical protein
VVGVDLAARHGVPWVRRHAQVPQVAAYDQAQGFNLVHEEQRTHDRLWMLAWKAERLDLPPWFSPGSGKERPRRLVEGYHLDELRPRVLAVKPVLQLGDRGLETVKTEQPGIDQRRSLVEDTVQEGQPVGEQRLPNQFGEALPRPGLQASSDRSNVDR